jgi:hypothetical protein
MALETRVSRILKTIGQAPPDRSTEPTLILTVGLPGSGKSTFARRLAPAIDSVVLESDALRRLLFGQPAYGGLESRRLFEAIRAAARRLLEGGRNVIVDATNLTEADRRPFFDLAEELGARLLLLRFSAPEPIIKQRLSQRLAGVHAEDNSSAGLAVYNMMVEREEPLERDHWLIDTSDIAAMETALKQVADACRPPLVGKDR